MLGLEEGFRSLLAAPQNIFHLDPRAAQSTRDRDQSDRGEAGCPDPVGDRGGRAVRDQDAAQSRGEMGKDEEDAERVVRHQEIGRAHV